jgi:hypothetical protein
MKTTEPLINADERRYAHSDLTGNIIAVCPMRSTTNSAVAFSSPFTKKRCFGLLLHTDRGFVGNFQFLCGFEENKLETSRQIWLLPTLY